MRGGTLQIGTEASPFLHKATITLFGQPRSIELPIFGSKVLACYACVLDMHGAPRVAWTELAATAMPGDREVELTDAVDWEPGAKIVIATTDFESPLSSHSEVATIDAVLNGGRKLRLRDVTSCPTYSNSGSPSDCAVSSSLSWPHLGETRSYDGREVAFRAEVGLLSRNVILQGDADGILCPEAALADDGVTVLSCNQHAAQIFLHSPGPDSLVGRLSNVEVRNAGQAFRLGRYAIHWHMIGDIRSSYQRNCSIHHSWNRGAAVHGVSYLRAEYNLMYSIMGHAFFIEDGVEQYNYVRGNVGIRVVPSMNLLNTDQVPPLFRFLELLKQNHLRKDSCSALIPADIIHVFVLFIIQQHYLIPVLFDSLCTPLPTPQTPAVFWVTNANNYIINNRAVGSLRYGIWYRPEISATGTSVNTPAVLPINIPILLSANNIAHSNGATNSDWHIPRAYLFQIRYCEKISRPGKVFFL